LSSNSSEYIATPRLSARRFYDEKSLMIKVPVDDKGPCNPFRSTTGTLSVGESGIDKKDEKGSCG
jgi:hypothetical protein